MTFTPGSDDDRTDTYEAQIKLQEDDLTAEQEFDEAQRYEAEFHIDNILNLQKELLNKNKK